jgi:hypothetical protein
LRLDTIETLEPLERLEQFYPGSGLPLFPHPSAGASLNGALKTCLSA